MRKFLWKIKLKLNKLCEILKPVIEELYKNILKIFKPEKKSDSVAKPKRARLSTKIMYGVICIVIIAFAMYAGAEVDYANVDGKVDLSKLTNAKIGVNDVITSLKNKGNALIFSLITAVALGLYLLYKTTEDGKRTHRKGVEYGSAKWGEDSEISELADKTPYKIIPFMKGNRFQFDVKGEVLGYKIDNNIIFSKDVKLNLDTHTHRLNLNSLIIGGSGAGKTRFFALPNIMQLNTSYVCTDPKGEILRATGKMLEQAGYKVKVFNTLDMEHSHNYNPFRYCLNQEGKFVPDNVLTMIEVLFSATKGDGEKQDFWQQKGKTMLQAIIFLLFEESAYDAKVYEDGNVVLDYNDNPVIDETKRDWTHLNFFSVTEKMRKLKYPPKGNKNGDYFFMERDENGELIRKKGESPKEFTERKKNAFICELDKDFIELEKRNPNALALRLYKEVRNAPEETGQSFLSSANVKTFIYNLDNVKNLTCTDNIHLETLGDEKTALFLILSATNKTYNFMSAMLYTQMFDTLANRANFKHGGVLPVHVRCITDEFANLGQIPDFEQVIAFVRSMGISLNVIVQNQAQIKALYEKTWEVITGNCDTTLFLGGKEETTLKSISESLGKETIDIRGYNRTKGKTPSTSENNQIVGRELMQVNELSTMPIDECIVMMRSHNPFHSKKYPLEEHPNYRLLTWDDNSYDVTQIKSITPKDLGLTKEQIKTSANTTENNSSASIPTTNNEISGTNQMENEQTMQNNQTSDDEDDEKKKSAELGSDEEQEEQEEKKKQAEKKQFENALAEATQNTKGADSGYKDEDILFDELPCDDKESPEPKIPKEYQQKGVKSNGEAGDTSSATNNEDEKQFEEKVSEFCEIPEEETENSTAIVNENQMNEVDTYDLDLSEDLGLDV